MSFGAEMTVNREDKYVMKLYIDTVLNKTIEEHNSLAEKFSLRSRLKWQDGKLLLGSVAQFEYNSYECVLTTDKAIACDIARSLKMQICFNEGE